jgi:hypothetical protein
VPHQVVAIERDVERAGRHVVAVDLVQRPGPAPRDRHAARADADQGEVVDAPVAFENFVRDAREGTGDSVSVEDDRHVPPLRSLAGPR